MRAIFSPSPASNDGPQSDEMNALNLFDLTGEVAVVIGATGVLGGAIAGQIEQVQGVHFVGLWAII